jgi:phage gpG-like protein
MSTAARMTITQDTLSPAIRRAASRLADTTPLVEAMCLAILSFSQRAFSQSALRAAAWPNLADGSAARLRRSGQLWKGLHVADVGSRSGRVGVNAIYGAVHQFGAVIRPKQPGGRLAFPMGGKTVFAKSVRIPARPFLPFQPSGEPTAQAATAVRAAVERKVASLSGGAFR